MNKEEFIPFVIAQNGEKHQIIKAVEEMAELSQLLLKSANGYSVNDERLNEEYADVLLTLEEIKKIFHISEDAIENWQKNKITRYICGGKK